MDISTVVTQTMEYYSKVKEMNDQATKKHGGGRVNQHHGNHFTVYTYIKL